MSWQPGMSRQPDIGGQPGRIGVKICGLSEPAGFDAAIAHGADWVGFVFFDRSPRSVTPSQAARISARHPGGAGRIGVFVRASDLDIAACLDQVELDGLQIYDTPERAEAIGARFGLPVWLARGVSTAADLPQSVPQEHVTRLVIESHAPERADRPGGNGIGHEVIVEHGTGPPHARAPHARAPHAGAPHARAHRVRPRGRRPERRCAPRRAPPRSPPRTGRTAPDR